MSQIFGLKSERSCCRPRLKYFGDLFLSHLRMPVEHNDLAFFKNIKPRGFLNLFSVFFVLFFYLFCASILAITRVPSHLHHFMFDISSHNCCGRLWFNESPFSRLKWCERFSLRLLITGSASGMGRIICSRRGYFSHILGEQHQVEMIVNIFRHPMEFIQEF